MVCWPFSYTALSQCLNLTSTITNYQQASALLRIKQYHYGNISTDTSMHLVTITIVGCQMCREFINLLKRNLLNFSCNIYILIKWQYLVFYAPNDILPLSTVVNKNTHSITYQQLMWLLNYCTNIFTQFCLYLFFIVYQQLGNIQQVPASASNNYKHWLPACQLEWKGQHILTIGRRRG